MFRWSRVGRGVPALVLALAVGTAAACEPAPCDEPYRAVAAQAAPFPSTGWPAVGTPRPAPPPELPDTDGDGQGDLWGRNDEGGFVIRRSSEGELVLDVPGDAVVGPAGWLTAGDLDGDGRSDLTLRVEEPAGYPQATYLVPGSLADGAYDLTEVGVLLGGPEAPYVSGVGDLDGDGRDDVASYAHRGGAWVTDVWYGADIWEGPPAGVLTGTPGATYPGDSQGAFVAGPGVNGLMTLERTGEDVVIRLIVRGVVRAYTTAGSGVPIRDLHYWYIEVVDGPNGELWLTHRNEGRASESRYAWDIANPCAGATAGTP